MTVNRDRVGKGTIGWICHRDGSFGAIAGLILFDGTGPVDEAGTDVEYFPGIGWPFPREYWVDGGRLRSAGWQGGPFKAPPNQFQNGTELTAENRALVFKHLTPAVADWLVMHPLRADHQAR